MNKGHPKQALNLIRTCNVTAIAIFLCSWSFEPISTSELSSPTFLTWLLLVCIARHGGLFDFVDSKLSAGIGCVIEFAALIILPFPLFALSVVVSCLINMADRLRKKHSEPFLGPDFNASSTIIVGFISHFVFVEISNVAPDSEFLFTIALFLNTLLFGILRIFLINTLISLDEGIAWKTGPAIEADTVFTEGLLLITGAILAITYLYNPYLILFLIAPALLLQNLLKKANKAELIYIDEKTGIHNYRYFDEKIHQSYLACKKNGTSLSLIFGDMDNLRHVNNNFGHSVGDEAIAAVGQVFKQSRQDKFTAARFGGEEFVLLLPDITKEAACFHAESIRKKVKELNICSEKNEKVHLSISLGVASFPKDGEDIQALIQMADAALYEAKRKGKDQVYMYETVIEEKLIPIH
ncbi:GGDEF domain-containing protein [Planococcus sp. YIM B11945]|uniref:GGDEF domain-containing protein n=1 Tax=Planococcus sp. YIM B11945 TaxID=3435410 RepID=UPI003D7D476A